MKFDKDKCQIQHLGWCHSRCAYRLDNRLECSPAERHLGILIDGKLNVSQQCALVAKRANPTLGCIRCYIAKWSKEAIFLLCSSLVWPHLGVLCAVLGSMV